MLVYIYHLTIKLFGIYKVPVSLLIKYQTCTCHSWNKQILFVNHGSWNVNCASILTLIDSSMRSLWHHFFQVEQHHTLIALDTHCFQRVFIIESQHLHMANTPPCGRKNEMNIGMISLRFPNQISGMCQFNRNLYCRSVIVIFWTLTKRYPYHFDYG